MKHIDEWLDEHIATMDAGERRALVLLTIARMPATLQIAFHEVLGKHPLYCTWHGERYRCNGASRLGDVWLTNDYSQSVGYHHRVDVAECSAWGDAP